MNKEQCIREAEMIEAFAKENLETWIILGESNKYDEKMKEAAKLRKASEIKNIKERREFLGM